MIIKKDTVPPKQIEATCWWCAASYLVDEEDLFVGEWGYKGFICPDCGKFVFIGDDRVMSPTYPITFRKNDGVHIEDETVNEFVHQATEHLHTMKTGDHWFTMTGDVMVVAFKFEDEADIYVCRNYEEDVINYVD